MQGRLEKILRHTKIYSSSGAFILILHAEEVTIGRCKDGNDRTMKWRPDLLLQGQTVYGVVKVATP